MVDEKQAVVLPWKSLFPKQLEVFNCGIAEDAARDHPHVPTIIFVEGPKKSTKTHAMHQRFLRHIWETQGARAAIVVKTQKSAIDGGVWPELVGSDINEGLIEQWINCGLGMEWMTKDRTGKLGPIRDGTTRTELFRVTNAHGGQSEVRLINIDTEKEVKKKLYSTKFSCIWVSELAQFEGEDVFRIGLSQLRMSHLKPWQHIWMADTNPSEEGTDSWIYKKLIGARHKKGLMGGAEEHRRSIHHIRFILNDNPLMSIEEQEANREIYSDDPGELARIVDGEWVKGKGDKDKHFADVFSPTIHVIGGHTGESDEIEVEKSTTELRSGWDMGNVNHAAVILEKRWIMRNQQPLLMWNVIEEEVVIDDTVDTQEFAGRVYARYRNLEELYKRAFEWRHWSDDTALNIFRASSGSYDFMEVREATNGEIELEAADKPDGSVRAGTRLIRRLLREQRLFVAAKCTNVIAMLLGLRKGNPEDWVPDQEHKHVFDALRYPIIMEMREEMTGGRSVARGENVKTYAAL